MNHDPTSPSGTAHKPDRPDLGVYLQLLVGRGGSDLYLSVGALPMIKVQGEMHRFGQAALRPGEVKELAYSMMSEVQVREFERSRECDLAIGLTDVGRFRINVFVQRGEVGLVARYVHSRIPSVEELRMPAILQQLVMLKRGLVLVVGAAGSGKSTTAAAMIDFRNRTAPGHILTVEDPIEFLHRHQQCNVDQREVGLDTDSFEQALRHGLRESPDMILIGEVRDELTMRHALMYAETGHLCLATLHASNAHQAIDRIINFFPEQAHRQVLLDLSLNLRGVVAQRLVRGTKAKLVPATEVMLQSPYIAELVQKGQIDEIGAVVAKSVELGMHTFDQSLYELYTQGEIELDEALAHAESRTDLSLRIRTHAGVDPNAWMDLKPAGPPH